ncbi:hypothetical protein D0T92_01085 [Neisseria zalophi]|uniref:Uncharacterized protein n=1 Tax=Neisseria zalophi TaxID=640030 RepID=A0A5J6PWZ7_9NEIS|nr:hypothetical protein D0T92_01085 [Neisseria zalophi]
MNNGKVFIDVSYSRYMVFQFDLMPFFVRIAQQTASGSGCVKFIDCRLSLFFQSPAVLFSDGLRKNIRYVLPTNHDCR